MNTQSKISTMVAVVRANKPLRLLLIAIALAVLAAFMAVKYLEMREEALRLAYQQPDKKTVRVVVAGKDLPSGTAVNSSNMSLRRIPAGYVHGTAVSPEQFSRIQGRRLIQPIKAGRSLLWTHVAGVKRADFSDVLDTGRRAVTVPIDELGSNAGMLRPGNHVDLYITMSAKHVGGSGGDVVLPLLQNVEVLATGTSLEPEVQATMAVTYRREKNNYSNVTVDLTPKQSALVFAGKAAGRITAILRNREDKGQSNYGHVQASDILSLSQQIAAESAPPIKIVRDKNGKIIGTVKEDGTVVDENGAVIGKQNADGTVVNNNGEQIGSVKQVVKDANGNVIGTVQDDGTVVDASGKVIGKQNANGTVVSNSGEIIGKIVDDSIENDTIQATNARIIEYLSGGNSKNGVAKIEKITVQ